MLALSGTCSASQLPLYIWICWLCRCAGVMMGRGSVGWAMEALLPPGAWTHPACKPLTQATWADLTGATRCSNPPLPLQYCLPAPACLATQHHPHCPTHHSLASCLTAIDATWILMITVRPAAAYNKVGMHALCNSSLTRVLIRIQ